MMGKCRIEGCDGDATRKQMCQKHYRRAKVHGDPNKTNRRAGCDGKGYINNGGKGAHVVAAERAIGRALPEGAQVHHVNGDRSDNRGSNLVICPSQKYHALLHIRARALEATGDANKRKCKVCRAYDDPEFLKILENGAVYHPQCNRAHVDAYMARRKNVFHV